jgi:ABC-type Fe3+/spermidine/putrescine transport system ATPase subunit
VRALDDVDLDVRAGEFLTLLGPSGSGKTTLLMVLAGFTRPERGSLRFGEEEVIRLAPHKRGIGVVFQNYALFPHMDVAGDVGYPLALRGVRGAPSWRAASRRHWRQCSSRVMGHAASSSSPAAGSSAWRSPAPSSSSRASC